MFMGASLLDAFVSSGEVSHGDVWCLFALEQVQTCQRAFHARIVFRSFSSAAQSLSVLPLTSVRIGPVRHSACQTRPEERQAGRADDEAERFEPPGIPPRAHLNPQRRQREQQADRHRPGTVADEPQDGTAHASHHGHRGDRGHRSRRGQRGIVR